MSHAISLNAVVPPELAGARFDQAAAQLFAEYSRERLKQWIQDGTLTLDGRAAKPKDKVMGGECLRAEVERLLEQAGGEGVVHHHLGSDAVGDVGQRTDVEDLEQRVRGRFQPEQRRLQRGGEFHELGEDQRRGGQSEHLQEGAAGGVEISIAFTEGLNT